MKGKKGREGGNPLWGKYRRTKANRELIGEKRKRAYERQVEFSVNDRVNQIKVEKRMKQDLDKKKKEAELALMAGKIPSLDLALLEQYKRELTKLQASSHQGKEEIAKMEVLVILGQSVMQTLLDMYNKLDIDNMKSVDAMTTALKFRTTFFNKWAAVNEEMRRSIETIHKMKYGERIVTEKRDTIEDFIEGKVTDVTEAKGDGNDNPESSK